MGSKNKQVKAAGSQCVPAAVYTAPQCGSEGVSLRGRTLAPGVGSGVGGKNDACILHCRPIFSVVMVGVVLNRRYFYMSPYWHNAFREEQPQAER